MMIYTQKLAEATALYQRLTRRYNTLSYLRLGGIPELGSAHLFPDKSIQPCGGSLCVYWGDSLSVPTLKAQGSRFLHVALPKPK